MMQPVDLKDLNHLRDLLAEIRKPIYVTCIQGKVRAQTAPPTREEVKSMEYYYVASPIVFRPSNTESK